MQSRNHSPHAPAGPCHFKKCMCCAAHYIKTIWCLGCLFFFFNFFVFHQKPQLDFIWTKNELRPLVHSRKSFRAFASRNAMWRNGTSWPTAESHTDSLSGESLFVYQPPMRGWIIQGRRNWCSFVPHSHTHTRAYLFKKGETRRNENNIFFFTQTIAAVFSTTNF